MPGHCESGAGSPATCTESFENLQTTAIRKRQVEQHDIDRAGASALDRFSHARGDLYIVARLSKEHGERVGHERAVFDYQYARWHLVPGAIEGEREEKATSLAQLALYPDRAAVQLDELARDCETEPGPVVRA